MRDPCCPDCAQSTGACPMHNVTVYPAYPVGYGTTPVIGARCPKCAALRTSLATAEAEVEHMKLVVMAHKTWENEAIAQASNANLALNKIRVENAALRDENARMINAAGCALGTDEALRSSACVEVLARQMEALRGELNALRQCHSEVGAELTQLREAATVRLKAALDRREP